MEEVMAGILSEKKKPIESKYTPPLTIFATITDEFY